MEEGRDYRVEAGLWGPSENRRALNRPGGGVARQSAAAHPIGGCREGAWQRRVAPPTAERRPPTGSAAGPHRDGPGGGGGPGRLPLRACLLQPWPTRACQAEGGVTDPGAPREGWWPQLLSHSRERDGIPVPPGAPGSPWGARNPQAAFGLAVHRGTPCPVPQAPCQGGVQGLGWASLSPQRRIDIPDEPAERCVRRAARCRVSMEAGHRRHGHAWHHPAGCQR